MKKILVIDDQEINLITIGRILKYKFKGCIIYRAKSGVAGVEIAKNEIPDLILLDIVMPEVDGCETLSQLRVFEETKSIPVVMLSVIETSTKCYAKLHDMGVTEFLSKPVQLTKLFSKVNKLLNVKDSEDKLKKTMKKRRKLNLLAKSEI